MASIEDLLFSPHILTTIFSFTNEKIMTKSREVCKRWANILSRVIIVEIPNWKGDGMYVDADRMMYSFPPFTGDVLELGISLKAKDQGWGNRKGRVWFVVNQPASFVAHPLSTCYPFDTVDHDWRDDKTLLTWDKDEIVKNCISGNFLQVWLHVGGGGGHSLLVKDFEVIVKYKPSPFEVTPASSQSGCTIE